MIPIPLRLSPCQEVDDLLSEYLDGELDGRTIARVEIHLVTCPGCARFAGELAATVAALHRLRARRVEGDGGAPAEASAHR
jgi:anti-sigma factor RsiW